MEDLIGKIECRSKSDSIMMRILRSVIAKTQEKLQFKEGRPIEFLHEQTTFYELAAILVEGCLKIVEEDESCCSKILSELIEMRVWLVRQIRDMKQLIMEKDREYRERLEKELRLREALKQSETELVRSYEKIDPEARMFEGDVFKLKESIDEEVLNLMKQKLEDEKMIFNISETRARNSRASSPNLIPDDLDKERGFVSIGDEKRTRRSHSNPNLISVSLYKKRERETDENMISNIEIRVRRSRSSPNLIPDSLNTLVLLEDDDSPSSNMDILKQQLDLVLGGMQVEEVLPLEKKWRKCVEREVESVLWKGFERELQTKFHIEVKKRDDLMKESWFDFIDEMRNLFHELKNFFARNDLSSMQSFPARAHSEPNLDVDFTQSLLQSDGDEACGNPRVWEIIKSHESVIRRQSESRSLLTREALQRERASFWIRRNEDINAAERLIQDAIIRLENLTQKKHKVSDLRGFGCRSRVEEKRRRIPTPRRRFDTASNTIQSFEAEIKKLQEERDALCFQISVIEDTYQLLFHGVMKDFSTRLRCREREMALGKITEDILILVFQEMVKQWKIGRKVDQEDYTESLLREDLYKTYFREMTEAWGSPRSRFTLQEKNPQEVFHCSPLQDCIKCLLREEIYKMYFKEMTKAWRSREPNERDLQQLYTSRELLTELEEDLEVSGGVAGEYYENSQFNSTLRISNCVGDADWSENVFAVIKKFPSLVDDVEVELHHNLESKCLRLEALKCEVNALTQPLALLRTRQLLYEKAFLSRSRNLKLAETEVDLLGDQVEALLFLLERIYLLLSRDARVLSTYFEVYDILKMIKIELKGGRCSKPRPLMTKQILNQN